MTKGDKKQSDHDIRRRHYGLLLIPDFALLSYACTVEPLRAANRLSGLDLYQWSHITPQGQPVLASNGLTIQAEASFDTPQDYDCILVCAGGNPAVFDDPATFAWLRQKARRGSAIGGVSGGAYLLARAELLHGYRLTLHWEHASAFREDFPDLDLRRSLYEIDRNRMTCGGGTAPLDMMHALIAQDHGHDLAVRVSEWFLQTQVREGTDPQRMALRQRLGTGNEAVLEAVALMERHLETPLPRNQLAQAVRLSIRQLERLFQSSLAQSIGAYYLALRLGRGRDLLRQTSLSVLEVALACGFVSASHFSRAYRSRFGHPPRVERLNTMARRDGVSGRVIS